MKEFDQKQGILLTIAQEEEIKINDEKAIITVRSIWKWLLEKQIAPNSEYVIG
jgi:predicted AAA+ superfamily ATPase